MMNENSNQDDDESARELLGGARVDRDNLVPGGFAAALLLPFVGFIIGIVLLARGKNVGAWVMVVAVIATAWWYEQLAPDLQPYYEGY